jgi:hypothetical protein
MSYYEDGTAGLGDLAPGATIPSGSQFALGFQVTGLPASAAPGAVTALRSVVGTAFRGTLVSAGWGPAFGVPVGRLYALLQTGRALTGTDMNTVAHMITNALPSQLPAGVRVTNTHFHAVGAGAAATPSTLTTDPVTGLLTSFGLPAGTTPVATGIDPATGLPYGTMLPPAENFFTQSVGGIPMWGLLAGGTVALGGIAYVMMSGKKAPAVSAAVKANARKRKRLSKAARVGTRQSTRKRARRKAEAYFQFTNWANQGIDPRSY